jgi:hypothetical protein
MAAVPMARVQRANRGITEYGAGECSSDLSAERQRLSDGAASNGTLYLLDKTPLMLHNQPSETCYMTYKLDTNLT